MDLVLAKITLGNPVRPELSAIEVEAMVDSGAVNPASPNIGTSIVK